jgi:transposase
VAVSVYAGNTGDPKTVADQIGKLREKFGLQRVVLVGDRGMLHKYFDYAVDSNGQLQWSRRTEVIQAEKIRDGLYLLGTNATPEQIPSTGVLSHYKNLLEVEDAFCHLKDYLRVRPVFHWRPDRVRNHVRICFLAYWLSAKLERQWRQKDQTIEVHNLLRQLQAIRLGRLEVQGKPFKTMVIQVPKDLNELLNKLGLLPLFSLPPTWAPGVCSKSRATLATQ